MGTKLTKQRAIGTSGATSSGDPMNQTGSATLKEFRVRNYRNFLDSRVVEVDPEATVLVGKNESGKTTLLDALWRLNPANPPDRGLDFVLDYPRWKKKDDEENGDPQASRVIEVELELGDEAVTAVEAATWPGALASRAVVAFKTYQGPVQVAIQFSEESYVAEVLRRFPQVWPASAAPSSIDQIHQTLASLKEEIEGLEPEDESDIADKAAKLKALNEAATQMAGVTSARAQGDVADAVLGQIPTFFYFADIYLLPPSVSIEAIQNAVLTGDESNLSDDQISAARFLRSVGLDPANLDPANFEALRAELEAVGNRLTDDVQRYWHQNPHLAFKVEPENIETAHQHGGTRISDRRLNFRVEDRRHRVTTSLSTRSTGFRWFVSFLAQFSHYARGRRNVVVLLDEPGVSLHAKAQADLLDYIDSELVANQQVIYTTHSAWMVPVRKIHRVRTVEEDLTPEVSTGAIVSGKMLSKDRDTLMPLQAALGYDVAQTLFIGPDSLVVEGISEVLYLYDMSDLLMTESRAGLDSRWHVCPAGSVARIPAMLGLLGNSVDTTVLIDSPANPTERGNIEERLYDSARLIEISNVTNRAEGDIEDLIDAADYLQAFNACFSTSYKLKQLNTNIPRITMQLEVLHGKYNHADVARTWVRLQAAGTLKVSEATKMSFETLFKLVNQTLSPAGTAASTVPAADPARAIIEKMFQDGDLSAEQYQKLTSTT